VLIICVMPLPTAAAWASSPAAFCGTTAILLLLFWLEEAPTPCNTAQQVADLQLYATNKLVTVCASDSILSVAGVLD
jgi:hypothetical protein